MATVAIMVGGAVLNAATFIGGNYLAKYLSGDSGQAALDEKKRHDLALEKYQNLKPAPPPPEPAKPAEPAPSRIPVKRGIKKME